MSKQKIKKRCIFFCPTHPTSLHKLLQIAASIDVNLPIIFVVINSYVAKNTDLIKEAGFEFVCIEKFDVSKQTLLNAGIKKPQGLFYKNNFVANVKTVISRLKIVQRLTRSRRERFVTELQTSLVEEYQQKKSNSKRLFDDYSPEVFIASSDRILGYLCCLLSEAKSRKIKVIIPPIAVISGSKEVVENRLKKQDSNFLASDSGLDKEFPEQFFSSKNGTLVSFFPVWMLKKLSDLNVLPKSPWRYGESFADILLLDGELQKKNCINEGIDPKKLLVVGDTEFDTLYEVWSKRIDKGKSKKAVIALPQLFEHGLLNLDEQIELVTHICKGAASNNIECILSLHPKMPLSRYQFLETIPQVTISSKPLRTILPDADVFIAINGSSTWLWAALCGIPTILCDWSGLDYDFIDHENLGLDIVRSKDEYPKRIAKLLEDHDFYEKQKEMQLIAAAKLAKFDGQAGSRISAVINDFIRLES